MEREILLRIDFSLYANKKMYDSWLNLPYSRGRSTRSARANVPSNTWATSRSASAYTTPTRPYRARSTLPSSQSFQCPFTFTSTT